MTDAVSSQTLLDGERLFIGKYTNISDGTGESDVIKIDVSTLANNSFGCACNGVKINKVWAMTRGMDVRILFEADADTVAITVPENQMYEMDFSSFGGIKTNAGTGVTGDVAFTTFGHTTGDIYTVILECIKTYASA